MALASDKEHEMINKAKRQEVAWRVTVPGHLIPLENDEADKTILPYPDQSVQYTVKALLILMLNFLKD